MTRGVTLLNDIIKVQQKIVPEILELLEKRYNILRTISYNQPVGRRVLSNKLGIGERIVRKEVIFLKEQNLIDIDALGMTVTCEGKEIIDKLKNYIHDLRGLSDIEKSIKEKLNLKDVIVVPGDVDQDKTVMNELGKSAAQCLRSCIKEGAIIALTGGTSVKEAIDNMPKISGIKDITVIPARGGMGRNVETQANTLVAELAQKISGNYRLLHMQDNLSSNAIQAMMNEKQIKEVLDLIHKANILVYGIGRADVMGKRRGLSDSEVEKLIHIGAVGEAFGYYFNKEGNIVYSSSTIGMKNDEVEAVDSLIAVAGGRKKADAILSVVLHDKNGVLVTDEGAGKEIAKKLNSLT